MTRTSILGIGTAVPAYRLEQDDVLRRLREALSDRPDTARWVNRIYGHCGVDTRYTCEPNLLEPAERCRFLPSDREVAIPTTAERMETYRQAAVPLAADAARQALEDSRLRAGDVTHLIAVSCTGQFLPGLEAELVRRLDLPFDVQRLPLIFMGCAAGLTAVRLAMDIVRHNPEAKVLTVAVELCTLHIQPSFEREDLFAAAFFGDGASACVVGTADRRNAGFFDLRQTCCAQIPDSAELMRWTVGQHGFQLFLSPEIPARVARSMPDALQAFWGANEGPAIWAIHPGGRAIVDALQTTFGLTDGQTFASRTVLRRYGNMSSATILFVLDELRNNPSPGSSGGAADGIAVAFGPGMAAELLRFAYAR